MLSTVKILGALLPLISLASPLATSIPSGDTIQLALGNKPVNVGSMWGDELRDTLIANLRTACPDATRDFCGVVPAGIKAISNFPIYAWHAKTRPVNDEDLTEVTLEIESMRWNGNREIYDILMDAVASAASLAITGNCNEYWVNQKVGPPLRYNFCNTVDRVNVQLPGEKGLHVHVKLKSLGFSGQNGMDCGKVRETAMQGLIGMEGRIAGAVGKTENQVYTAAYCL
ncbi:hypothetical protein HBH53_079170 [Parastagonospora nodorum]|nr:hypothetical protein HBH53_079170 [Parastagonospora nodorum]KAH4968096.1 hypothetical protein HBI78_064460 [Parastagonospora nodorum]KAH5201801.1 hypothetical protein HBH77_122000 [Parastagonospora nodorum]KAH5724834.1 hypothetical protein HBI18_126850 [Parastagonospora nodorum]